MLNESQGDRILFDEEQQNSSPGKGKSWQRVGLIGAGGLFLVVGATLSIGTLNSGNSPAPEEQVQVDPIPVETLTIRAESGYEVERTFTGEIAARRSSEVGFERGGKLVEVMVEEGDRVSAGEPLARLDTRNLESQRRQAIAARNRAVAQLSELEAGARQEDIDAARAAVRNLDNELKLQRLQRSRREFLYREGAIAREQLDEFFYAEQALEARLDEARSQLEELLNGSRREDIAAARATVQELEARIEDLEISLNKSVVKAPFSGFVGQRYLDEGAIAQPGQAVVRLVERGVPEARIGLPTKMLRQMQPGDVETASLGSETYTATVTAILPEVEPQTRTQVVVLELHEADIADTHPGQTVRLTRTETIETAGYWLPISALNRGLRGLWTCYVVVEGEEGFEVEQRAVEILDRDSDRAFVRGTLEVGDRVVKSGTHRLVPGQLVRPLEL